MFSILIVEDDSDSADFLRRILEVDGYRIFVSNEYLQVKDRINSINVDLVLLDVNLTSLTTGKNADHIKLLGESLVGQEGFEIAAWLRDTHPNIRVIFLTSGDSVGDRVRGLDLGGDDYITKPFHTVELKARIRSTLRRSSKRDFQIETFANWQLNTSLRQVSHLRNPDMAPINLSMSENNILIALLDARGETVSRESLSKRAFGRPLMPHDRAVDTAVSKIRAKLNDERSSSARIIETMHGSGYRIVRR